MTCVVSVCEIATYKMSLHGRVIADLVRRLPLPARPPGFVHPAALLATSLKLVQSLEEVGLGDRVEALEWTDDNWKMSEIIF